MDSHNMTKQFLCYVKTTWWTHYFNFSARCASTTSGKFKAIGSQLLIERRPVRTRFAPSPTGYLHLGSLRTALFNYLIAKATGGQFILRIEDTDQKRTVPDAISRLYDDLRWTGIQWDEGPGSGGPYGPYQQSQRLDLYRECVNRLLESGKAYRCFCTKSRLTSLAIHQNNLGLPVQYDRHCAYMSREHSNARAARGRDYVIRLKVPDSYPLFNDLVYGLVRQNERPKATGSFEDPILMKSDGFPTYHFANVVDDHHMKVTDVIRGAEWMPSTHKHLAIYEAFGWEPPSFAHVGLLLDKSGQKLSKRKSSVDIAKFREEGIFPESLTNFVALMGWSHKNSSDVMSMKDLIENASMKYTKGDTIVCFDKLRFLQRRHAARYASSPSKYPLHSLYHLAVLPIVRELENRASFEYFTTYSKLPPGASRESFVQRIIEADSTNYTIPREFIERNIYFFAAPSIETLRKTVSPNINIFDSPQSDKKTSIETLFILFRTIHEIEIEEWDTATLRGRLNWIIEQRTELIYESKTGLAGLSPNTTRRDQIRKSWSKFVHEYLRWALCAGKPGPDGIKTMLLLGKEHVSERLLRAEELLREKPVCKVDINSEQETPEPRGSTLLG